MFGAPFSPKRAACGAQRRPRRCGRQICRFFFSRSPSSPCAADPSAASAAIVTDSPCRRGKIRVSSSENVSTCHLVIFGIYRFSVWFRRCRGRNLSVCASGAATSPIEGRLWHVGQVHAGRAKHDVSGTGVLRCPGQRQLDKVRSPEAAALCSKARPFAPYRTSGVQRRAARPANGSPFGGAGTPQA